MNKRLSFLALFLIALLFVGAGCWTTTVTVPSNTNANTNTADTTVAPATIQATISIDAGDDAPNLYLVEVQQGATALDALQQAATDNNFVVITKRYDFGDLVDSIDGVASAGAKFWLFKVNGEAATVGAGAFVVHDGDTIEFVYTDSE